MPFTDRSTPPALPTLRFSCSPLVKVFVTPLEIWPLNNTRPLASETKSQLFARVAVITTSTPTPVEIVASSVGTASTTSVDSGVGSVDAEGCTDSSVAIGISGVESFEVTI